MRTIGASTIIQETHMTTTRLTSDVLEIRLTPAERIAALHGDLRLPRGSIRSADVLAEGLGAVRGLRAPGLALPGLVKLGTWRGRGGSRFVAVRRGQPALRLTLTGGRFDTVLVSTPHAAAIAAELDAG
jgi:hypothetical protein